MSQGFTTPLPIPLPVNQGGTGTTASTGTGNTVLSNSPTLTTPIIEQINDTNGNAYIEFMARPSPVNWLTVQSAGTLEPVILAPAGSDTNIPIVIGAKGSSQVRITTDFLLYNTAGGNNYTAFLVTATGAKTVTIPDASGTIQLQQSSPTIQIFTSGSGTYTTPAGVKYIVVTMVGGGGGGSSNGGAPSNGTDTTFGTTLLTANANNARAGGSFTINAPAYGFGVTGGTGGERIAWSGATFTIEGPGGIGGSSFFGGSDSAYGAGGKGAFVSAGGSASSGIGGGAGGYVCAYIDSPSATYSYTVGTGGTGAGTGANGVGGVIIVTEYYQ